MPTPQRPARITVPKSIRDHLGLRPGDEVEFQLTREGQVVLKTRTVDLLDLAGIFKAPGRAVTLAEMDEAIRQAASRD